ncbi:MAG: choice-of-anchor D domain-containing protein [Candidatus Acidiferrum sp.]
MFLGPNASRFARGIFSAAGLLSIAFVVVGCAGYASSKSATISQAGVAVSPGTVQFKNVPVGQTVTQTMQITNTNSTPVQISAVAISDKQFAISGPSVPRSILPGMNLQYTVAFTPNAAGNVTAAIKISDSVSQTPLSVGLTGVGQQKTVVSLQVTPASVNFGNLLLKTTGTQNVTLQNTGNTAVAINGVSVAGSGFGYADLSPGYSLSPNQKVTFQVWFKPQVQGAASGTLSVLAANLASPAVASLAGDGVTSNPSPTPTPTPGAHTVHLTWGASDSTAVGYRLYRSDVAGGPYSSVNGSNIDALAYDDTAVTSGTTYYYVVTAVNGAGEESVYSNQATAAVPTP